MNEIPTFQPFTINNNNINKEEDIKFSTSNSPSSSKNNNNNNLIFENRTLILNLIEENINEILYPNPTFLKPLQNYLNLNYKNEDILSITSMVSLI